MNVSHMSGGPIKHFAGAWAKFPFVGSRAHYWHDITKELGALTDIAKGYRLFAAECGVLGGTTQRVPALEVGNWPKCKRCEAALRGEA